MRFFVIFIIFCIVFMLSGLVMSVTAPKENIYVDCYDEYNNKMIGQKCIQKVLIEPYYNIQFFMIIICNFLLIGIIMLFV